MHVGIIMDGNGRWAQARGLGRVAGHVRGARRVSDIVNACPDLGIGELTLFAFSTENWQRPVSEVTGLMRLFSQYVQAKTEDLKRNDVRVQFIGMRRRLPAELQEWMRVLEERTAECGGLCLTIALDYGGRDEITRAVGKLASEVKTGRMVPEALDEALFASCLDTREVSDPDLIIRTSGEFRMSNFLLWQSAYSEFSFPQTAWPEFTARHLEAEVTGFRARERRFGGTGILQPAVPSVAR